MDCGSKSDSVLSSDGVWMMATCHMPLLWSSSRQDGVYLEVQAKANSFFLRLLLSRCFTTATGRVMNVACTLQTASLTDACQSQCPLCCCEPHLLHLAACLMLSWTELLSAHLRIFQPHRWPLPPLLMALLVCQTWWVPAPSFADSSLLTSP